MRVEGILGASLGVFVFTHFIPQIILGVVGIALFYVRERRHRKMSHN